MRTNIAFVTGKWVLEVWDGEELVAVGKEIVGENVQTSLRDVEALVQKAYELGLRDGASSERKKRKVKAEL